MDSRVEFTLHLITENFYRQFSLQRIAESVNLSPPRLRHLYKAETGFTPTRHLHTIRMQHAKELLETTFLSVKEIMVRSGLHDESHFVRDFKRDYGSTPLQYRQSKQLTGFHLPRDVQRSHFGQ
jgi:AraC family transcriptional regulator of arabinose operon